MSYSIGGGSGSGDEDSDYSQRERRRSSYRRLTLAQTNVLEKFIRECPRPDEAQRMKLAEEIDLDPKQIKFWFQNKRTQIKNLHDRANNNALRLENERLLNENALIREALKKVICEPCGGPPFPKEEHELYMQKMRMKNTKLKEDIEKVSINLAKYLEGDITQPELEEAIGALTRSVSDGSSSTNDHTHTHTHSNGIHVNHGMMLGKNRMEKLFKEKTMMSQIAVVATEELAKLARMNEPFWIDSTLNRTSYDQVFTKANHFHGDNAIEESSKYSATIPLSGMQLVDMFLDAEKWTKLFPTFVTKAETMKVYETGLMGNRDGALQLMYEEIHVLSPLVRPREFNFVRYCKQVEVGVWVITDVSVDSSRHNIVPLTRSWRHPSGIMIREVPNGGCTVTWIEHVEVDDKLHTHILFKDLVGNTKLYGAERWVRELQRICERSVNFYVEKIPDSEPRTVIKTLEARRSVMRLSHRMVKMFCERLTMSDQLNFPITTGDGNGWVRVSIHKGGAMGEPRGTVVCVVATLPLPVIAEKVFDFLSDHTKRYKWDLLSDKDDVEELAHIPCGLNPGNYTSVIKPSVAFHNYAMILQESFSSPVGSHIIYAPVNLTGINVALRGEDSKRVPILPSGFVICPDGKPNLAASNGSLLTVVYQVLAGVSSDGNKMLNMQFVASINTLLTTTIEKIKDGLNCDNNSE